MAKIYQSTTLRSRLREQRRQMKVLGTATPFYGTGMHPNGEGGIDSDNFAAGSSGYSFKADGNAEFNDLTLRGGIIGNDALTTPVYQSVLRASAGNFGLTTPFVEKAGVNVTVPAGFSQALVTVFGRLYIQSNPNTSGGADGTGTDALYVSAGIDGNYTLSTPTGISGNGGYATTVSFDAFVLTGLTPGASIRLNVQASSGYQSIAASVDNYVNVVGTFGWLR